MFSCPQRPSSQAWFGLTGVFLILVVLNLHPILHRVPLIGIDSEKDENQGRPIFLQSYNGGNMIMNRISLEDVEVQRQDTAFEGQDEKNESSSVRKETTKMSPDEYSNDVELSVQEAEYSDDVHVLKMKHQMMEHEEPLKREKLTPPARIAYLADEELEDLQLSSQNATNLMTLARQSYIESIIKRVLNQWNPTTQRYYSSEQLNSDSIKMIPVSQIRRVLIVSTWRSGSSFLGEIVSSYPGTFYSFEPFHFYYGLHSLEGGNDVPKAVKFLKDLSSCNFTLLADYAQYMKNHTFLMCRNKVVWEVCASNWNLCFDSNFLRQMCQYLPLNVIKIVRLGLAPIQQLLEDASLDMRVVYLVRDPRGTLHSRLKLEWCTSKRCYHPPTVCDNLLTDLKLAKLYAQKYPDRFLLVRYEDLSLEPELVTKKIFTIAGVPYHSRVAAFLKTHTKLPPKSNSTTLLGTYTTFRNSQTVAFAWRDELTFEEVDDIQRPCEDVLRRLGYTYFRTAEECSDKNISVFDSYL